MGMMNMGELWVINMGVMVYGMCRLLVGIIHGKTRNMEIEETKFQKNIDSDRECSVTHYILLMSTWTKSH